MKAEKISTPRGVRDILPEEQKYFTFIKKVVRHRCRQSGFRRISTPVFEFTEVFTRGIGEESDIVSKEMYTFEDRKGKSLCLKPESTAGIARAYVDHGMKNLPKPLNLYYIEPHFRYDRPQKGRFRQFHQFGVESIGEDSSSMDAQVIYLAWRILKDLQIEKNITLQINSLGDKDSLKNYLEDLINFYSGKERSLCDDCKNRLSKNPLRLLDCKKEDCQILASVAPGIGDSLNPESKKKLENLKGYLDDFGIKYEVNQKLVRGLDYYTGTVFEFVDKESGGQNTIAGGGRYDNLIEQFGGEKTAAVGFAAGVERIVDMMKENKVHITSKDKLQVFVSHLGEEAKKKALPILIKLREQGIKTVGVLGRDSMKSQMRAAASFGVNYTLILGVTEVRENKAILRDMNKGSQEKVPLDQCVEILHERLKSGESSS